MMITSKGQATIPQRIREEMGLMPGCEVEFVIRNGKVMVDKRQPSRRGKLLLGRMRGAATGGMTRLTRDPSRYRTHFPRLPLICP